MAVESVSNDNKRIAKNTILLSIRMVFTLLVSLYTTRVVLNQLGVSDYGIYNVVCGFVSMFSFLSTSMANGIQRFYNFELGKNGIEGAKNVYNVAIVIQILLVIILVILSETVGLWYVNNKMVIDLDRLDTARWIFQFSIISFVFSILQVPFLAAIMAHEKMNYYALVSILDAILKLVLVLLLSFLGKDKLLVYGCFQVWMSLFVLLMYYIYAKKKFNQELIFQKKFDKPLFKSMLSFSGWNIFGRMGDMCREQGVNIILNLFFGTAVNAARGVAYQVIGGLQGLVTNLSVAIRPQIVQSYAQNNISRTLSLSYSMGKVTFLFLYIVALPIVIEIDYVLKLWIGENVPEYTAIFLRLAIIVSFINLLNAAVSAVVHATGKMALYQVTGTISVIMVLPVSYIWLKLGGSPLVPFLVGIVFAIIMQIVALFVLKRLISCSIKEYLKKVILPIFLVVISTIAIPYIPHYYMQTSLLRFIVVSCVSIVFCGGMSYIVGLNKSEKNIIKSIIDNFIKIKK